MGRSRGGFTTKIHVRCEGTGKLITFLLTPGQASDINFAKELMETGAILYSSGKGRTVSSLAFLGNLEPNKG